MKWLKALYRHWLKFAHGVGKINTAILMTVFYLVVLGLAKLGMLFSRQDPLDSRWKDRASYWKKRKDFPTSKEAFLKPY